MAILAGTLLFLGLSAAPTPSPTEDAANHDDYTETIPGTKVSFDMIAVPGGAFSLGSPADEKGRAGDEGPQRRVRVRPFWVGRCEVTWDEFDAFFRTERWASNYDNEDALKKNADAVTRPTPPYIDETQGFGREGHPVVGVSHHAAMEYCHWLSKVTGKKYRLPTEAEWEYACRAGSSSAYFFGDDQADLEDHAWFRGNSNEATHPVGRKKPNAWGLHDVHGNVAEWCLDHYQTDAYAAYPRDKLTLAPVLMPTEKRYPHVVRGGSWDDDAVHCRSAARLASDKKWNKLDPEQPQSIWWLSSCDFVGFRVVRAVEEEQPLKGLRSKVTRKSP
jgi:formylglycine-generating enzyme required for sulfatase activity